MANQKLSDSNSALRLYFTVRRHTKKTERKMNVIKILTIFLTLFFVGCNKKPEIEDIEISTKGKPNIEIITKKGSKENLPKEIIFEGKIVETTKLKDIDGEHVVLLTETEKTPSKEIINIEHEIDKKIFVYDYLLDKSKNNYTLNWKIQDFENNCDFNLIIGFLKGAHRFTDLNKDGKAEIWVMYQKGCVSDISPLEMKIIMYEGKQKYALRGTSIIDFGDRKFGGEFKLDENFTKASKEIKNFVLKMWKENNLQKFE